MNKSLDTENDYQIQELEVNKNTDDYIEYVYDILEKKTNRLYGLPKEKVTKPEDFFTDQYKSILYYEKKMMNEVNAKKYIDTLLDEPDFVNFNRDLRDMHKNECKWVRQSLKSEGMIKDSFKFKKNIREATQVKTEFVKSTLPNINTQPLNSKGNYNGSGSTLNRSNDEEYFAQNDKRFSEFLNNSEMEIFKQNTAKKFLNKPNHYKDYLEKNKDSINMYKNSRIKTNLKTKYLNGENFRYRTDHEHISEKIERKNNLKMKLPNIKTCHQEIERVSLDEDKIDLEYSKSAIKKRQLNRMIDNIESINEAQLSWNDKMEKYVSSSLKNDYEQNFYNFIKAGRIK